jgi:hypothetical protein
MQRLLHVLPRVGEKVALGAILVAALGWFYPTALGAMAMVSATSTHSASAEVAAADLATLDAFEETQVPLGTQLRAIARKQSLDLNTALRAERARILDLRRRGDRSLNAQLVQQSFDLLAAKRDAWDLTWRQIGRKGADLEFVQNALTDLQAQFVQADEELAALRAQEAASGSVTTYTPPEFTVG